MALIRPEAAHTLHRWREVILAGAIAVLGGWVAVQGGYLLPVIGLAIAALGLGLGIIGWRRLRFAGAATDPGVVQVIEGQITYMGPTEGGFAGLSTLQEIALLTRNGRRVWRLSQAEGETLYIPTAAAGTEALFDAFAGLPGLDSAALLAAVEGPAEMPRIVWRRRALRRLH
ncbi:MAG: hypothetical protein KGI94_01250 [Paracoccaceae bacterium]|nr:hypothetical protein [Paracoccaceae bacterium]MDE3123329.1 hypothetical protein [Paracoccaceae bacterium]MDE3241014.1 hypothetical protein [Paracoccaceae bacterium]